MKLAIFENIMTPGGHEVDFDRILAEEFTKLGHDLCFYVPEGFKFSFDYHLPVEYLPGKVVNYSGLGKFRKIIASLRRERNRQLWYRALYEATEHDTVDAIVVPTSTYRYLRALSKNKLKNSKKPIIFILHGIHPKEAPKFLKEAEKLLPYPKVKLVVLTFSKDIFGKILPNIFPLVPPTYLPRDLEDTPPVIPQKTLRIGFFGQYRKEKKLEDFLKVFLQGNYVRPVELFVQGATMHPADAKDFERIIEKYRGEKRIKFLHQGLLGRQWQEKITRVDALLMPYSAPRYRYHWGGMLFTAIGHNRPVVVSDDMNPEVLAEFQIGATFKSGNLEDLSHVLTDFINTFHEKLPVYQEGLRRAGERYAPEAFARSLEELIQKA